MRKVILLISLLALCQLSKSQTPNWLWAELGTDGGSFYEYASGLLIDTSGNLFLSGRSSGTMTLGGLSVTGGTIPFVGKYDSSGTGIWLENQSYSGFDYAYGLFLDKKGNTYNTGCYGSGNGVYTEKYNSSGVFQWGPVEFNNNCAGYDISADGAGNVYSTGDFSGSSITFGSTTLSYGGADWAGYLTKQDSSGNFLWAINFYGTGANDGYTVGRSIAMDGNANIYLCGAYQGTPTFYSVTAAPYTVPTATAFSDLFVAKYDSSGNLQWVITAPNAGISYNNWGYRNRIAIDSCNNLYVTGYFEGAATFGTLPSITGLGTDNAYVAKYNTTSAAWEWVIPITSANNLYGGDVALDKKSDVYMCGTIAGATASLTIGSTTVTSNNYFLAKFSNSNGALQWLQSASGTGGGVAGVAIDKQGYVYFAGTAGGAAGGTATFGSISLSNPNNYGAVFFAKLDTVPVRTITPAVNKTYCPGETIGLPFTETGIFNSDNNFIAQLSDSTGNFATAKNIGKDSTDTSGIITITIPANVTPGTTYLIRVISTDPGLSSWANGCGAYFLNNVYTNDFYVTIGNTLNVSLSPVDTSICSGASVTLIAGGGSSYLWSNSDTGSTIVVTPVIDTTVYKVQVANGGCTGTDSATVILTPFIANSTPTSTTICLGTSVTLLASGGNTYSWSPSAGLNSTTGDSVLATPTSDVTYTVSVNSAAGCSGVAYDTIGVVLPPNVPTINQSNDTLYSSSLTNNQWFENGKEIPGANESFLVIGNSVDTFTVVVNNPANGCTSSSGPDITSGINQLTISSSQLSVYPNPTNSTINVNISSSVVNVNDWNLRLTDVLGQTIYTRNSLNYNNVIDLANLAGGVYFITVTNKTLQGVFNVVKQ